MGQQQTKTIETLRADLLEAGRIIAALKHTNTVKLAQLEAERGQWQESTLMAREDLRKCRQHRDRLLDERDTLQAELQAEAEINTDEARS